MNIETMETIRRAVAEEAVEQKLMRIPQIQIPYVEFNVPEGIDMNVFKDAIAKRMTYNSNIRVYITKNGRRIRVEYRT